MKNDISEASAHMNLKLFHHHHHVFKDLESLSLFRSHGQEISSVDVPHFFI